MEKPGFWLLVFLVFVGGCRSSREGVGAGPLMLLVYGTVQPCEVARDLKADFERTPFVEHVAVTGFDARVLAVELDNDRLAYFALSFAHVEAAVRPFFEDAGLPVTADSARSVVEATYSTCAAPPYVEDLAHLVLAGDGQVIPLSAVAEVSLRVAPQEAVYHEGERALRFQIQPLPGHYEEVRTGVEDRLRTAHARRSFNYFFAQQ